jgi:hypothetical protein
MSGARAGLLLLFGLCAPLALAACNGGARGARGERRDAPAPLGSAADAATALEADRRDQDGGGGGGGAEDGDGGGGAAESTTAICGRACAATAALGCAVARPTCVEDCARAAEQICPPEHRALLACAAALPPTDYACARNGLPELRRGACAAEQAQLGACISRPRPAPAPSAAPAP